MESPGVRIGGWNGFTRYCLRVGVKFVETAAAWIVFSNELAELVAKTKRTRTSMLYFSKNTRTLTQCTHFHSHKPSQFIYVSIRVTKFIEMAKSIFSTFTAITFIVCMCTIGVFRL